MAYLYKAYGYTISSELELSQLTACRSESGLTDITIQYGSVPDRLEHIVAEGLGYQWTPNSCLIDVAGIARFQMEEGRSITIQPAEKADPRDIQPFLLDSVIAVLLHQRGKLVMQASAILGIEGAILFLGTSGTGKSTFAAAFHQLGYPILSDGVCLLTVDHEVTIVPSGQQQIGLWPDTLRKLKLEKYSLTRVRPCIEKRWLPLDKELERENYPVTDIVTLYNGNHPKPEWKSAFGPAALNMVRNHAISSFLGEATITKAQFRAISDLLKNTHIASLQKPVYSIPRLPEILRVVTDRLNMEPELKPS